MLGRRRVRTGCATQALDAPGSYDHLLIGTSLPWLLPAHCPRRWRRGTPRCADGERGARAGRGSGSGCAGRADLEHWAAFPQSFDALAELIAEVGLRARTRPATICVLSGDVHHAYVAEPGAGRAATAAPTRTCLQLTCSPVHNSVPLVHQGRLPVRLEPAGPGDRPRCWPGTAAAPGPPSTGAATGGPWFGNQLMTLTLRGREALLRLEQAGPPRNAEGEGQGGRGGLLTTVEETRLSGPGS